MFAEPVELLQAIAPRRDAVITAVDIHAWGPAIVAPAQAAGFLVADGMAARLGCPNCDGDHVEPVMRDAREPSRFLLMCPEAGLLTLRPEQVLRWRVDHAAIAAWTAGQLGATSAPLEPIAGEAWRWDRVHLTGAKERWSLVIVRDLGERTSAVEWGRLHLSSKSVVLSMGSKPAPPTADGPIAYAGWLWNFCDYDGSQWVLDREGLMAGLTGTESAARPKRRAAKPNVHEKRLQTAIDHLIAHIESAQAALRNGGDLLPTPSRDELARVNGCDKTALSKTINRSEHRLVAVLLRLEAICRDHEQVRTFHRRDVAT